MLLAVAALTAMAWIRPDPLAPVPEVEEVVGLALALSPLAAGLALAVLAATALAPGVVTRSASRQARDAGEAVSLLLIVWAAAPLFGAFPVPWVGIGMSAPLGSWLGVGLLVALLRRGEPSV